MCAPIALFVYNRPAHTRKTIEALKNNELADRSELFVFSDGPRDFATSVAVSEVRSFLRSIDGFKTVHIIERPENVGLATSIIDGVTALCDSHGEVVVVEDDLITSSFFLRYMNEALERYRTDECIMHVSGYMFPIDNGGLPDSFFLRPATCWGWATWARAWKCFEKRPNALIQNMSKGSIRRFNLDDAYDYWSQVTGNATGAIDTWAVFWYASIFLMGGLCLHPARSLVRNIGLDNTGVNCGTTSRFDVDLSTYPVSVETEERVESNIAVERLKRYFRDLNPTLVARVISRLHRLASRR